VRRLSHPTSRAHKLRLLVVVLLLVLLVLIWQYFTSRPRYNIYTVIFLVIGATVAVLFTIWRQVGYLADEVFEEGSVLIARRNGVEARVPFENIVDVRAVNASTREGIEVQLQTHIVPFGARIVFWPLNWKTISGEEMDVLAATLKSRLVRRGAA
jgi:hypothetical protein